MPVYAIPPTLTDETTLFATMSDANDFFSAFALPAATTGAAGIVKKATTVTYSNVTLTPNYYNIPLMAGDGTISYTSVVTQAAYEDLQTKFEALSLTVNDLIAALRTAGIVT